MVRQVVVLCGPPGAGKTTAARESGLEVFDRDDDRWLNDAEFRLALKRLGERSSARAVVIRSGATSTARATTAELVRATAVYLLLLPPADLKRRVRARGRADLIRSHRGIDYWFERFDRNDGTPDFPGWAVALDSTPNLGKQSATW